jgi:hypothetical protein
MCLGALPSSPENAGIPSQSVRGWRHWHWELRSLSSRFSLPGRGTLGMPGNPRNALDGPRWLCVYVFRVITCLCGYATYLFIAIYWFIYIYACMYVCVCMCVYVYIYIYTWMCVYMIVCVCVCEYVIIYNNLYRYMIDMLYIIVECTPCTHVI